MLTCKPASMVRRWASIGPHRCDKRVLLCGVKVCLTIKWIILFVVVSTGLLQAVEP